MSYLLDALRRAERERNPTQATDPRLGASVIQLPASRTPAWPWLFDPSYSAFNWLFAGVCLPAVRWRGVLSWRSCPVIPANVVSGDPALLTLTLASRHTAPDHRPAAADVTRSRRRPQPRHIWPCDLQLKPAPLDEREVLYQREDAELADR